MGLEAKLFTSVIMTLELVQRVPASVNKAVPVVPLKGDTHTGDLGSPPPQEES